MPLARAFHQIDKRGILTDSSALAILRRDILKELDEKCVTISNNLKGKPVVYSKEQAERLAKALGIDPKEVLNLSSVPQLKEVLKNELHIKLKVDRYTKKESTGEESLNEAFAATSNPVLKDTLRIRELTKVLGTYVDSRLNAGVFYSCYSVTGTVTGRRASRKNFLGFGSNGQNQPKHSDLGKRFRGTFIARPGYIFVACDQVQAEDWIVQGIIADVSGHKKGVEELQAGVDRHQRLAAQIFGLPLDKCGKDSLERYLGKKTRHAGNYGMQADKMAAVLAAEGYSIDKKFCAAVLQKFHEVEPYIQQVFHKYIEHELCTKKLLVTPFGRARVFHGLRPYGDNGKIFREGYAQIPQSTVGDNTGMAILYCERFWPGFVLQDGHDAILGEAEDNLESIWNAMQLLRKAFHRIIRFPNGFELEIPIEFELGYSLAPKETIKCPGDLSVTGLQNILQTLPPRRSLPPSITGGVQPPLSQPLSNEIPGLTESNGNSILTSTSSLSDAPV
jgi:hypothetical protein